MFRDQYRALTTKAASSVMEGVVGEGEEEGMEMKKNPIILE